MFQLWSSLNRSLEQRTNKRPILSDLRDSGAIEQDANVVIFVYRDEVYEGERSPYKGVTEAITGKFRGGVIGTDYLSSQLHISKFSDLAHGYTPPPIEAPNKRGANRGFEL